MPLTIHSDPSVFRLDDYDTIRIGKTRVTLDTLVAAFNSGQTPEQIVQDFPTLDLADIYVACGYYLRHQAEVDAYLKERDAEAEEFFRTSPLVVRGIRKPPAGSAEGESTGGKLMFRLLADENLVNSSELSEWQDQMIYLPL